MSRIESGDRLVVSFIDHPDADRFRSDDWPYHVTLLPRYRVSDDKLDRWHDQLEQIADSTDAFQVEVGEEAYFGRHHNTLGRQLAHSALRSLHFRLLNAVTSEKNGVGGELMEDAVGRDYVPHIKQRFARLIEEGQVLKIASLSEIMKIDSGFGQPDLEIINNYDLKSARDETAA